MVIKINDEFEYKDDGAGIGTNDCTDGKDIYGCTYLDKDLLHKMDVRNGELRSEDCKCYSFWKRKEL